MRRVFQKLGDGSTTLAFRDFITMLRKMQYPGQRSLTEEEMKFLYDLSNRGDCDALCDAIFDKERLEPNQFGFTVRCTTRACGCISAHQQHVHAPRRGSCQP